MRQALVARCATRYQAFRALSLDHSRRVYAYGWPNTAAVGAIPRLRSGGVIGKWRNRAAAGEARAT